MKLSSFSEKHRKHDSIEKTMKNPNTLKRMPPTQCILSGGIRSTKLSRRPYVASTRCRSLGGGPKEAQGNPRASPKEPKGPDGTQGDPKGPKGTNGTQGDPRGPKGTQRGPKGTQGDPRAPSAPLGGWGHGALWGYSEAIPNGKPFRMEGYYERKALRNESRWYF